MTTPAYSNGMTMSPSKATYQRMGREKATPESFQRMDFSNLMLSTSLGNASPRTSGVGASLLFDDGEDVFSAVLSRGLRVRCSRHYSSWQSQARLGCGLPSLSKALCRRADL